MKTNTIATSLVRWYLNHGMPDRLADAVLVCRYLEAVLDEIPATQTGRIQPIFDHSHQLLRDDWRACLHPDLWLNTETGQITKHIPGTDGEPDTIHTHLPHDIQRGILFGRFAHIFR